MSYPCANVDAMERESWEEFRARRLGEPGAAEAYEAARVAFELGRAGRSGRVGRRVRLRRPAIPRRDLNRAG
jgi:hypothetical protein